MGATTLRSNLVGYDACEEAAELAIFSRQHLLIIGPPGTGKSLFARQVFSSLEGETFFTQVSADSDETVLFGPMDFKALREEGRVVYSTREGSSLAANWWFIDELFDASDMLLRMTLGVLNERVFARGDFGVRVPLETCIATANYTRVTQKSEAVLDRFALRVQAPNISGPARAQLWDGVSYEDYTPQRVIPLEEIYEVRRRAADVSIPQRVMEMGMKFAAKQGWSPRRERVAAWICKVRAALMGRGSVTFEDLVAVAPYMILSLDGDLASTQARVRAELDETARTIEEVDIQRAKLSAFRTKFSEIYNEYSSLCSGKKSAAVVADLVRVAQRAAHLIDELKKSTVLSSVKDEMLRDEIEGLAHRLYDLRQAAIKSLGLEVGS